MKSGHSEHALVLLLVASLIVFGVVIAIRPVETYDPFSQRNFPCAEDEALLYVEGNHDGVECASIESLTEDARDGSPTVCHQGIVAEMNLPLQALQRVRETQDKWTREDLYRLGAFVADSLWDCVARDVY